MYFQSSSLVLCICIITVSVTASEQPKLNSVKRTRRSIDNFYPSSLLPLVTFNGKSYFFGTKQKMTWVESLSFCRAFGMDLVSIETQQENNFLKGQLAELGMTSKYVWTSGNKIARSTYHWLTGEPFTFRNWHSTQPDNPSKEHCLILHNSAWYDLPCEVNRAFDTDVFCLCEGRTTNP